MMKNKEQWEVKKLGEVANLSDGDWIESKDQSEEGIRLVQTGNIGVGVYKYKDDKPHYISEETFDNLGCTEIFSGDCLISRLPDPIGRACIIPNIDYRMITAVDCSIVRFKKNVSPQYFVYYTQSSTYNKAVFKKTTGSTRKRISRKNLELIPIPVPPLSVQSSIVSELDLLSGVIEKKKQQLAELDNLAHAIFHDMFGDPVNNEKGWEVKKLGEVCNNKGSYGAASPSAPKDLKRPRYIRITDIDDNGELNDDFVVSADEDDDKAYLLKEGDLLFARSGATVGKTYLYQCKEPQIYAGYLIKFSINTDLVNPLFAFCITKTNGYKKWIKGQASGAAQPNVNAQKYGSLPIPLPPLPLQQLFATKIASIENQKGKIKQSLAEAETFFQSRMSYYFD